jgi:hypothetical protein
LPPGQEAQVAVVAAVHPLPVLRQVAVVHPLPVLRRAAALQHRLPAAASVQRR